MSKELCVTKIETKKYPFVVFFRFDKYSAIDSYLLLNKDKLNCSIYIINNKEGLNYLFDSNYQILVTYGDEEKEYIGQVNSIIADRMRMRWIHFQSITSLDSLEVFNRSVNYCFIDNCLKSRIAVRTVFSLFTTTYNSYEKIVRCYQSLKNQLFLDWEWVILDDSPDDKHFPFLKDLTKNDYRVRLYKRSENSGNIGNVKNEAVSLCRGEYLLELDHDDELLPTTLSDSVKCFEENKDVGFIYMNYINIYENGENFSYGDFFGKGYANYYCEKYNNKWVYVSNTPNINNVTLTHLVSCPNHPRIWRKDVLMECGNYSEFLPICDDYEILLRTALKTKMAKIYKLGYIQYMNQSNNNFSLIRNSEINRIAPQYITPIFYDKLKINEKMKEMNAYEDEKYMHEYSQLWKRENFQHNYCNLVINNDHDMQYCLIGIDSLINNIDKVKELYKNFKNDFILLENKASIKYVWWKLEYYQLHRFKCYALKDAPEEELENYFMYMYRSTKDYEIINNNVKKIKYNTEYSERFEAINSLTKPTDDYLEIGVETGFTYSRVHFKNKEGVDPDPKFSDSTLVLKTSDDYFIGNNTTKDVIFIDGMHQIEYVVKDINNSIQILKEGGKIFLDDIIPLTYDEQCKIPKKHYYEKGILKYGEAWTGDVWKAVYYILLHYMDRINVCYFYHENYRGVACITFKEKFQIPDEAIETINKYDYYVDFTKYVTILENL
jgi:glycosyltransferase involved in cell wall biosynthesis